MWGLTDLLGRFWALSVPLRMGPKCFHSWLDSLWILGRLSYTQNLQPQACVLNSVAGSGQTELRRA